MSKRENNHFCPPDGSRPMQPKWSYWAAHLGRALYQLGYGAINSEIQGSCTLFLFWGPINSEASSGIKILVLVYVSQRSSNASVGISAVERPSRLPFTAGIFSHCTLQSLQSQLCLQGRKSYISTNSSFFKGIWDGLLFLTGRQIGDKLFIRVMWLGEPF